MTLSSFHRRALPDDLVDFSSPLGRARLVEALTAGTAEAFYPLVAHLHTQAEPAWCGFGTLVTIMNALGIDPGRVWKGPWRFFAEELLVCCKSLEVASADGLTLAELGCVAACNGAQAVIEYAEASSEAAFRVALEASVRAPDGPFIAANYDRAALGQTGTGHFSPLAAWHAASDHVLLLDVARFKYPPHWVPTSRLWAAMARVDPDSRRSRGWLSVARADAPAWPRDAEALTDRLTQMGVSCPSLPPRPAP